MPKFLALLLTLIATPAAAWTVMHERDRMTDKTITWASVRSGDATLLVGCLNGQVQPRLTWGRRIGFGDLGVSYRFDAGPVTPRMAMVSQDGTTLYAWPMDHADALAKMRKAKRLRVSVGQAFYDFDLAAGEGMPVIRCGDVSTPTTRCDSPRPNPPPVENLPSRYGRASLGHARPHPPPSSRTL